jgi:hypothetical protein
MTGMGEVEGSDAYHGPDDLLPPESLVTHGTVPTRQLRHKRSCYIMPGTWSLNWGDDARRLPPWPCREWTREPANWWGVWPRHPDRRERGSHTRTAAPAEGPAKPGCHSRHIRPVVLIIFDMMLGDFYIGYVKVLLHAR